MSSSDRYSESSLYSESPLAEDDRPRNRLRRREGYSSPPPYRRKRYVSEPSEPVEEECSCESTSGGGFFSITWMGISLWVWIIIILVIIALIILLLWWYGYFSKSEDKDKKKSLPRDLSNQSNNQENPIAIRRNLPRPVVI